MTHTNELTLVRKLERLYLVAMTSNDPEDWAAYDTERRRVAVKLGLDCPARRSADAPREGRAA